MIDNSNGWYEYVAHYLNELQHGDAGNAYYSLLEVDYTAVPQLIAAYYTESSLDLKLTLIELIYCQHWPESLTFFAEILQNDNSEIWKLALDGIYAINQRSGIDILLREKSRLSLHSGRDLAERIEWIDEAIEQLRENLEPNS